MYTSILGALAAIAAVTSASPAELEARVAKRCIVKLPNSGFESGSLSPWTVSYSYPGNTTSEIVAGGVQNTKYSFQIDVPAYVYDPSSENQIYGAEFGQTFVACPGQTYTASLRYKAPAGTPSSFGIAYVVYDNTRNVRQNLVASNFTGEWQKATFNIKGIGKNSAISVEAFNNDYDAAHSVQFDNVQVVLAK